MTTPRDWALRHPVAAFLALTIAWSWGLWSLLFQYGGQAVLQPGAPPQAFLIAALGACGPSLAGLTLTAWLEGRAGLAALRRRLRPALLGHWWPVAGVVPAVTVLVPLLRGAGGQVQDLDAMSDLLLPGLALGLSAALMEEFGWRGFLLPRLLQRGSALAASLWLGLIWGGLWHGYADYFGVAGDGPAWWALMGLLGPGLLTAWSLLMTWVHLHTGGSLLAALLVHASISSSALVLAQSYDSLEAELGWTAVAVAAAWLVVGGLWRFMKPENRPLRPEAAGV